MELRPIEAHDILGQDIIKYNFIKKVVSDYANLRSFPKYKLLYLNLAIYF